MSEASARRRRAALQWICVVLPASVERLSEAPHGSPAGAERVAVGRDPHRISHLRSGSGRAWNLQTGRAGRRDGVYVKALLL
eukprot:914939-Prymnesium_polylepis.1